MTTSIFPLLRDDPPADMTDLEAIAAAPPATPCLHVTWPPERFFWSVLEVPGSASVRSAHQTASAGLDLLLADDLPVPTDSVHAVYARLDDRRVVACAARRAALASLAGEAITLCPAALPGWIEGAGSSLGAQLNLLVGGFEPPIIRRARAAGRRWIAAAAVAIGALVALGFARRGAAWEAEATLARSSAQRILVEALPREPPTSALLALRLRDRLELLRRTNAAPGTAPVPDAALNLAALLRAWPEDPKGETSVMSVTPDLMSASVFIEDEAQGFLSRLGTPEGWTKSEPRVSRGGAGTTAAVEFRRAGAP